MKDQSNSATSNSAAVTKSVDWQAKYQKEHNRKKKLNKQKKKADKNVKKLTKTNRTLRKELRDLKATSFIREHDYF